LAARSAKSSAIRFLGQVSHEKIGEYFASADLFVFPSIREFGGGVVLEAMAMGAVPIVVNYGGPAELVTSETGYCLDIRPRAEIVQSLRQTIETIAANPTVLLQKINNGQHRVKSEFTWQAKAQQVVKIYRNVLSS
jgi:glycogen synthase